MKRLKKTLCFTISLILIAAIAMPVSAAGYTDSGIIKNAADVRLLDSLGIMRGHADGTFEPDGFLTRAQAAKMIYVARTGTDDKAYIFAGIANSGFRDVPRNFWGAGYINYCLVRGFVSGRGNGIFDPNGRITGYEFIKLLLGVMGYDAVLEGFKNSPVWKMNVIIAASEAGITEGYAVNPDTFLTRDQAAKLTANMLFAKTVTYDSLGQPSASSISCGQKYFDLRVNTGVITANEGTDSSLIGQTMITIPDWGTGKPGAYDVSTSVAQIGQTITIYAKGDSFIEIYGTDEFSPANKVISTDSALSDSPPSVPGSFGSWLEENGMHIGTDAPVYITKGLGPETSAPITANLPGEVLRAVDNNGDQCVDYVIKIVKTAATVTRKTSAGTGTVSFDNIPGDWAADRVEGFDGLSVGSVILAYEYGGILHEQKAASVTGKMTSATPSQQKITIDGKTYRVSGLAYTDINGEEEGAPTFAQWSIQGSNFNCGKVFYLDDGGNIIKIQTPAADTSSYRYAYVLDAASTPAINFFTPQTAKVKLLYEDGTTAIVNVNKLGNTLVPDMSSDELGRFFDRTVSDGALVVGKIFRYTINADGSADLTAAAVQDTAPAVISKNDPNLITGLRYADNQTRFVNFNPETGSSQTYTGIQNIPGFTAITGAIVSENSIAKMVFMTSAEATPGEPKYVFITGSPTVSLNPANEIVFTYPVFQNGAAGTLTVDDANGNITAGLYTYTVKDSGKYTFAPAGDVFGKVTYAGGEIVVIGQAGYVADDRTPVYIIGADMTISAGSVSDLAAGDNLILTLTPGTLNSSAIYVRT